MQEQVNNPEGQISRKHLHLLKRIEEATRTDALEIKPVIDELCNILAGEFCTEQGNGVRVIYDNLLACTEKFIATSNSIESRFETF